MVIVRVPLVFIEVCNGLEVTLSSLGGSKSHCSNISEETDSEELNVLTLRILSSLLSSVPLSDHVGV